MEFLKFVIDFILHIDVHLKEIVFQYETWTYLILFCIIFCETGFVVTPFLPGDSLLFAAGALAAGVGAPLSIITLVGILMLAAVAGDNSNYFIGKFLGHKIYQRNFKLIKREYIDKTHKFYEKHGGKTVVIARFMPILRTFAPFVAGIGEMKYIRFFLFSIGGTILWVNAFCWAGYLFANNSFVQKNFTIVVFAIIGISLIAPVYAVVKQWWANRKNK